MKLTKRTILITGGTSGIGREMAEQLLSRDNVVIVTGRDQSRLDQVKRELPSIHVIKSDVSDPIAIESLQAEVIAKFPGLDVLINNAGVMRNLNLNQDLGLEDLTREIDINLSGPVRMVQQFLPNLKKRKEAVIVMVSSGLAFIPLPVSPIYCATKAALHSYTQSLRVQLSGTNVRAIELAPPATETPLFRAQFQAEMKTQNGMDVSVLVRKALAGIEAGKLEICPGLSSVLKLMSRVAPEFMLGQLVKMSAPKR